MRGTYKKLEWGGRTTLPENFPLLSPVVFVPELLDIGPERCSTVRLKVSVDPGALEAEAPPLTPLETFLTRLLLSVGMMRVGYK
jgi:hypothetical protein